MSKLILVTGSTGYVATRLIPALLSRGYRVRCLARNPGKLGYRPWRDRVEVYQGDVLTPATLTPALQGAYAAYYFIHNMSSGQSYRENERNGARNFGEVAKESGLQKIIYLGGLGGSKEFRHMRSREETGQLLRESGVPTIEFRSSVIIGSGSISFELIRYITTWLPFIPAPRQTNVPGQPIGISDLLNYLLSALDSSELFGQIIEIGGSETLTYPDLMAEFARQRGLVRPKLALPFFIVSLSARIADRLTPVPFSIAYPLMEELTSPSVIQDATAQLLFPEFEMSSYAESVRRALGREEYFPGAPWTASLVTREPLMGGHVRTSGEGFLIDYREKSAEYSPELIAQLFNEITGIGWTIEAQEEGKWIRFRSKKKLPGVMRVEFQYTNRKLTQTVMFDPFGLPGMFWWYSLSSLHSDTFPRT